MHMRTLLTLTISAALVVLAASSIAQAQAPEAKPALEPAPPGRPPAEAPAYAPPTERPAQPVDPARGPDQPPPPRSPFGGYGMLLMMGGVFVLMYLFMGRSRRKRESKRREMLGNLQKGDKITTIGGAVGTVIEVREDEVTVKVDETSNTRMKFARWAIRGVGAEAKKEGPEERR